MLKVTRQAEDAIGDLLSAGETPARGGLHIRLPIIPQSDVDRLEGVELEVVGMAPPRTLQVRAGQDCRLFLDLDASHYLRDKVLHTTHDTDGAMRFVVTRTAPADAREVEAAEPVQ